MIEVEFDLMSTRGKIAQSFEKSGKFNEKTDSIRTCDITFVEQVDLAVQMEYPIEVLPGEEMGDRISVHIENKGNAPVGGFNVELVLSEDDQIPVKPAVYSETFVEDALLKDAMETVAGLKPGESITLKLKETVKVPPDTPPGRYYLGAVIDPENKIEEATEENNIFARFIMISYPQPKRVVLEMPDTHLIYDPANFGVKIVSGGVTFSDGKDWRKCRIRPYIHQLKHVGWENCHWELNTVDRSVWKVKDGKFCKIGGLGEEVKMKMEVRGGSKTNIPSQVVLRLKDTCLDYEPGSGKLKLMSYKHQCAYIPFWKVARIKSHLYQFRHALWDFFWEVNTFKKQASLVNGGKFGTQGGTPTPLNINVTVED
ncbi:MAG: hypothetical protein GY950_25245 [bacterium]|nr:hypothetical protein [bacterium]